jgi:D-alanyl-D-alanine carboxypeptidase
MTSNRGTHLRRTILGLIVATIAVAGLPAPASAATPTGQALNKTLDAIMADKDAPPGLAMLIQRNDGTQFRRRGVADIKSKDPFHRNDHYRIASVAKAFNGAVAMALADAGKLKLVDTLDKWIPGVLPKAGGVTIIQALEHTAGLPDYIRQQPFIDTLVANPSQYLSPLELLEYVKNVDMVFTPGTRYGYSDTDNVAVGLVAEAASGLSYNRLLDKYIYKPAGLTSTSLPDTVKMPKPSIHGYTTKRNGELQDDTEFINPALAWASGGIVSTMDDVNRFFRAYVGGDLFGPAIQEQQNRFIQGNSSPPGPGNNNAMPGLFRYQTDCGTFYGHTGSYPGYRLFAAASRNGNRSVVFVMNEQITPEPGQPTPEVSKLVRRAQQQAICHVNR